MGQSSAAARALEVVVFTVGKRAFLAPRADVRSIRPSPRLRLERTGGAGTSVPTVSLSQLLGLDRDASVDRRVVEVEHWGEPIGLEVTGITGIRQLEPARLRPLPPLVSRCVASQAVLGLAEVDGAWALALDLPALLVERGVEVSRE